jgi:hypothetical protein
VAIRIAKERGIPPLIWLLRVWLRRIRKDLHQRRLTTPKNANYPMTVSKIVFSKKW